MSAAESCANSDLPAALTVPFSLLLQGVFYLENDINGYHVIEVPGNTLKFLRDIGSQCRGNFDVMSCNV